MTNNSQLLFEVRHSKPQENPVQSFPVNDGINHSKIESIQYNLSGISWKELLGLSWIIYENDSDTE